MFDAHARRPIEVRLPASGVFVLESHHARGFRMPAVRHDFHKVIHPFSGEGWLVRHGARVPLRPGDVVFVPAGIRHHIEDDGSRPLSLYALCLSAATFAPLPESLDRFRHFPDPVWSAEVRSLFRHLLHEQTLGRAGAGLMIVGLAWQGLGHLARAADGRTAAPAGQAEHPARARVAAYAAELTHTFYHHQSIDEVAAALGLSRRRFTQLFREIAGETWLGALHRHRLVHARRLLRETGRSIASIGYECGYDDLTTFYRAFKASTGTSPLAWRMAGDRPQS
jgi:AraC family L-rhamnose operon regulatory protein RhaS